MARNNDSPFGQRLREAFKGASNTEIARILGVKVSAVGNYIGGRVPPAPTLIAIANYTHCSLHWLITGQGEADLDPLGFLDESQRRVLQKLAEDRGVPVTELLHELVTNALVKLGSELFAQYRTLHATEFEQLQALFRTFYSTEDEEKTKMLSSSRKRKAS